MKWPCLFSAFQSRFFFQFLSLNVDSKSSLWMYHGQLTVCPTFSWFLFPRCHLLQNHRNKLAGKCLNYFFSLLTFASSYFPQAFTLTKLLLCEPTTHRVTFLLARRQIPVSWKCKCNSVPYSMSKEHLHHILLTFHSCFLTDDIFVCACVQKLMWPATPQQTAFTRS